MVAESVAAPHDVSDNGVGALTLVLNGLVQGRVELLTFDSEAHQTQPGQHGNQFVGHRFEWTGL